jgi:DNA-binding CsgD family transcriptional regulator
METGPADDLDARIQDLWDNLSEFDASRHDEAFGFLLRELCGLVGARNANWIGAVRLADTGPRDPLRGWRPRLVRFLHPAVALDTSVKEQMERLDDPALAVDVSVVNNVAQTGRLRANRMVDLAPPEWLDGYYYRTFYLATGIKDAVWAGCPVNADSEVYIGLFRGPEDPPFARVDCDHVLAALRGLKWFMRQQLLSHGLLVANAPLTPVERETLQGLLAGQTEKEIARAQERGLHTVHEYVKALYRKFGVRNRATLMALWLGKMA